MTDLQYESLKKIVLRRLGLDLNAYKPEQMRRRIENFQRQHCPQSVESFLRGLETDPALAAKLTDHLTINVTEFFRDPHMHENLLDKLVKRPVGMTGLRIWSAGCSNGAEAYSVCMGLTERLPNVRFSILATDFDQAILDTARKAGPYSTGDVKHVPGKLMEKYFDGTTFTHPVRQRVTFKRHNLLEDRFESGFDLIMCRNVMIYFTAQARQQVTQRFIQALKPGGLLFLGSSEALMSGDAENCRSLGPCLYEVAPAVSQRPVLRIA